MSHRAGPAALVVVVALTVWLISGVSLVDAIVFLGYEAAFSLIPGIALHRALRGRRGVLEEIAVGWATGYAFQLVVLVATGATGTRSLFAFYPLAVVPLALWIARRRRAALAPDVHQAPVWLAWGVAAVAAVTVVYVAATLFPPTPLPGTAPAVDYDNDTMFFVSMAAEAKHHWPVRSPFVSGEALPYHVFSLVRTGAISRYTGIELPVAAFRLQVIPLAILLTVQVAWLGLRFSRSPVVALGAASLVMLGGEVDITPTNDNLANGSFVLMLWHPPHALALVLVIPLIWLLFALATGRDSCRSPAPLALVGLLVFALGGTKGGSALPVLAGALGLFGLWSWAMRRRVALAAALGASALAAYVGLLTFIQYERAATGLTWDPFAGLTRIGAIHALGLRENSLALKDNMLLLALALAVMLLIGAAVLGIILLLRETRMQLEDWHAWLLALSVVGVLPLYLVSHPGQSNLHSLWYAYAGAAVLATEGFRRYGARWCEGRSLRWWVPVAFAAVWLVLLGAVGVAAGVFLDFESIRFDYAAIALLLCMLGLLGIARLGGRRIGAGALLLGALLLAAPDQPFDALVPLARSAVTGTPSYAVGDDVTPELVEGLKWLRDTTPTSTVIATNNQYSSPGDDGEAPPEPMYHAYSALSERRVFLEGFGGTPQALQLGLFEVSYGLRHPFPERERLNDAVFLRANRESLAAMRERYGVDYLLVDRTHVAPLVLASQKYVRRSPSPRLRELGRLAFENSAVVIIDVR